PEQLVYSLTASGKNMGSDAVDCAFDPPSSSCLTVGKGMGHRLCPIPKSGRLKSCVGIRRRRRSSRTEIGSMFSRLGNRIAFRFITSLLALSCIMALSSMPLRAQEYTAEEIVESGHRFFGATSGGLA